MFDVGRSMFNVHQFLSRSDWTLVSAFLTRHTNLTSFLLNGRSDVEEESRVDNAE